MVKQRKMTPVQHFEQLLARREPLLALAPMQDVTDLGFWRLMTRYGGADVYYTEYFRVHPDSHLEKDILTSITHNPTDRPVVAQMIGNDIPSLIRGARELQEHAVAAIDLNLGCPAPVVYKKCAGGGLLRDVPRVEGILGALREAVSIKFTVKTRLGFDDTETIDVLVPLFAKHGVDLVTIHGRTVTQMYRDGVRYDLIAKAKASLPCPVLANGNVGSHGEAEAVVRQTGVHGLMIGRGAIRNPWMFEQIRQHLSGQAVFQPTAADKLAYIEALYETVTTPQTRELDQVNRIKKHLNFFGPDLDDSTAFLHEMRRCTTRSGLMEVCTRHLKA
ncbi:tRNA-dihydrouridine synthase family protein [Prosthecobacter sp.]|uniref:tRNA dihydrouridine synthase n=1 Tax=Prosthecobacter sp. TaxID=1965333 RepID=UPI0025E691DF|nr:tRNA-dihydrouridine synthase family protein [Prosthecobacter sp.]